MISSTYKLGARVARVACLFYYFLKFFKKSEAWGEYNWNIPLQPLQPLHFLFKRT